jgi:membrane protease YdiL (CAAX protease family)
MPQAPVDQVLVIFQQGMMLLSIAACIHVFSMRRNGPVVPYESRRPVPWGPVGSLLVLLLLMTLGYQVIAGDRRAVDVVENSPKTLSSFDLISSMLAQLIIVLVCLFIVAMFCNASARDLGLASSNRQRLRDVSIGAAACLASLAPVFFTQFAMMYFFFPEKMQSGQPLVKQLMANPDPTMLIVGGVATVIMAPICEEITFRLLFQGWLERWEDERLGWRTPTSETPPSPGESQPLAELTKQVELSSKPLPEPVPPRKGVGGLAYGWFPIFVSAAAFGLAHYGEGPEPVPLFLFGLVLGYLYQRTHRILPGIVAHALFNLFTMIILWRMLYHRG